MIFKAGIDFFQTEHIVRIRKIQERDAAKEPVRYSIYLTGQSHGVDVAGDDLPPFEAWLNRELLQTEAQGKPANKVPEKAKVA